MPHPLFVCGTVDFLASMLFAGWLIKPAAFRAISSASDSNDQSPAWVSLCTWREHCIRTTYAYIHTYICIHTYLHMHTYILYICYIHTLHMLHTYLHMHTYVGTHAHTWWLLLASFPGSSYWLGNEARLLLRYRVFFFKLKQWTVYLVWRADNGVMVARDI